jgi:very-short-patch-repair endonuclease
MRGFRLLETRRARALRKDAPSAEAKLWAGLRNRQLGGYKFVRQEPIGPYFADFACREKQVVIEVDGATHSTDQELARDAARTAFLNKRGYRVIRFVNADVFDDLDAVLETILATLDAEHG